MVLENAQRKAAAVAASGVTDPGSLVLGVDTVVALGQAVYGKPADRDDAESTLQALSGASHRVLSGICLIDSPPDQGRPRTAVATTTVRFRTLDEPTLDWYLAGGEWRERAGGYAIQGRGAALVESIEGDYLNVVGLPVATLLELKPGLLRGR
jgi:septum formation protein